MILLRRLETVRMATVVIVVTSVAATGLSACGGDPVRRLEKGTEPGDRLSLGRQVFLSQCQGCHALGRLGAPRPIGGDLTNYDMTPAEVESFARIMPTPRRLSPSELDAVSVFAATVQRQSSRGPARREGRRSRTDR